jgi:glyoxylase-like metal-dependent hydrolase (beta-lactamase superfamily II)
VAADTTTLHIDELTLTRVLYADVLVPPEIAGLSVEDLRRVPWRAPLWATDDQLGASASAWVIDAPAARVVLEPLQAADHVLHAEEAGSTHVDAFIELMDRSGFPIETADLVVISHIEGVGMIARRDGERWKPLFPNARIAVSDVALMTFEAQAADDDASHVWRQLIDDGYVDTYRDGDEIVAGMTVEHTGAHNPGHCVFHFGAEPALTWLGHLAISPLHLATGPCPQQHPEPERVWELLRSYRDDGRLLTGPLWPSPGVGRWTNGSFTTE